MEELIELESQEDRDRGFNLYETDFYAWTQMQAKLLQQGEWHALDVANLVEEIESLGKQQKQELRNRLGILIGHLLKWEYQPELRGKSWEATIEVQREDILDLLQDNPSLKSYLEEAIAKAYKRAIALVVQETPLSKRDLPPACPYTLTQILDPQFPEGMAEGS
jgi:hypothetical protein